MCGRKCIMAFKCLLALPLFGHFEHCTINISRVGVGCLLVGVGEVRFGGIVCKK